MSSINAPVFIDFEASSLDLVASYPIEVGVCLGETHSQSWLIRPHVLWRDWSESAQQIHGIRQATLMAEGTEIGQVVKGLERLLPEVVYCDAWTFDSFWLHRLYKALDRRPRFQLESVSLLLTSDQIARWGPTRRAVIAELGVCTHRAGNDARILHETWRRVTAGGATRRVITF